MTSEAEFPPAHPVDVVLKSPVFRLLNMMIDERVRQLMGHMDGLPEELELASSKRPGAYGGRISTRTHEEGGKGEVRLPYNITDLDRVAQSIAEIKRLEKEIGELQRQKLRLQNDWDFTHGDPAEQLAVFGSVDASGV